MPYDCNDFNPRTAAIINHTALTCPPPGSSPHSRGLWAKANKVLAGFNREADFVRSEAKRG